MFFTRDQLLELPKPYVREQLQARISDDDRRGRERHGDPAYSMWAATNRRIVAEHRAASDDDGAECTSDRCGRQTWPCSWVTSILAPD